MLVKTECVIDEQVKNDNVRDLLTEMKEVLSKLEKELGSKQAHNLIECHEEDVLLWTRKTMTVVLFLLAVS